MARLGRERYNTENLAARMMTLGQMRSILESEGIRLTRSLGQNFLHDHHQIERILREANLAATDQVLEIGPGLGALTEGLIPRVRRVFAIEKDARLIPLLRARFGSHQGFELLHADALEELQKPSGAWDDYHLVSNLPYSVASPILVECAHRPSPPRRLVVTLQLEVAQRLASGPGHRDYGVLTLLVQRLYQPRLAFKIPRTCFFPVPEIDSACLVLERRPTDLLPKSLTRGFAKIVKRAFSERRKMMIKLLKSDWPEVVLTQTLDELKLPNTIRAEAVSLEAFCHLTRRLCPRPLQTETVTDPADPIPRPTPNP